MRLLVIWFAAMLLVFTSFAFAGKKPTDVECIAPAGVGGGWDLTCRVPAAEVMPALGLVKGRVRVTNMAGAVGGKAYAHVVTSRNNDENLIVAASMATAIRLGQNLYAGLTVNDVRWLGALGADYGVIAVHKDSPFQNLKDLMNALKKDPGNTPIAGGGGVGDWDHFRVLLVAEQAGVKNLKAIRYIAFDSGGKAMLEVIGKRAAAFTGDTSEVLGLFDAGQIRILGVLSPKPVARLAGVPTARAQGYDVIGANWRGYYAPKGISEAAYNEWVGIITQVADSPEWKKLRDENGLAPFASFGADFETFIREQVSKVRTLSQQLGFHR